MKLTEVTEVTELTERKRSKKKEDTATTEYYLNLSKFWSGQVGVPYSPPQSRAFSWRLYIFGGGCFGKAILSLSSIILCSSSDWLYRCISSIRPSVVGMRTSSIIIEPSLSRTSCAVRPPAQPRSLCRRVTIRQYPMTATNICSVISYRLSVYFF